MIKNIYFKNNFLKIKDDVLILNEDDQYAYNFSMQWKTYQKVQIDSLNNFDLSKKLLEDLLFKKIEFLKEKDVLEIGSGSGRFTEYISKFAKNCVTADLSSSIYYNVSKNIENVIPIKCNYIDLIPEKKFDVVICRGVLQHTPNPEKYMLKLYEFIKKDGLVYFDFYPLPKIGLLHPKYIFWRPLIKKIYNYQKFELFLIKNIKILLKLKRLIKNIFFNSNFIADTFIPVWDYKDKYKLSNDKLEKLAILDTLDGLFTVYDKPFSYKKIEKILIKNNIKIINSNIKNNNFETTK